MEALFPFIIIPPQDSVLARGTSHDSGEPPDNRLTRTIACPAISITSATTVQAGVDARHLFIEESGWGGPHDLAGSSAGNRKTGTVPLFTLQQ